MTRTRTVADIDICLWNASMRIRKYVANGDARSEEIERAVVDRLLVERLEAARR